MKYAVVREHHNQWQFSKLYNNRVEAHHEAERLCLKENDTFYVVELLAKCYLEKQPVKWAEV